jgi:hypothetical protein
MAERTAAHARHVAHLEAVTPWHDPLPPPVAPPLQPDDAPAPDPRGPFPSVTPSAPAAPGTPAPAPAVSGLVGPPVPARARRRRLVDTSEMPIDGGPGAAGRAENGNESETRVESFGPLGRPPWDALVRRPLPREAPTPLADGPRGTAGRARNRSRRDPLDWMPRDAERPPDPEWDDGVPVPLSVPLRVRARSGAVLLALTGVFGVLTATALLVAVVMAVGALDKL